MGGTRSSLPLLIVAALFHQSIALKCNAGCVGSSGNVFNYQPGTVYKYELDGNSVTSLAGADGDVSKMKVKASAEVAALPNCGFSVSLTSFQVSDKDGMTVEGDKGQPVVFAMNNGVVQSDICSAKDEPSDALNIKRAVISLLQSSPKSNHKTEVDIFGTCPTEINVHKSGPKLKVKKTKNLINCGHRQNLMVPFKISHYHSMSDLQSVPWASATQHIEQDVEGQVKWAMSKEQYVMPPAAGLEAGVTVTVTTTLSLKGTGGGATPPAGIEKEKTILLGVKEHTGEDRASSAAVVLKKICEGAQGEMGKDNANLFGYLAYTLSRSNKATFTTLFNQVKQGQICADKEGAKKILFDAIFDSQSADGVQAMAELLKNKEVTGLKAKVWYSSLGNVKHATIPSLKAVSALIDSDSPIEAYLGAGNLLGRYCEQHACEGVAEVNQLQKKLTGPLTKGCKAESLAEEDKLLASIKGIGNSHYLSVPTTKQLLQCATDHSVRSRVRSASLDALHADPNKDVVKKSAITLLKDKNEDSEIRIKAYLLVASCPCGKTAAVIKEVLEKEESFQVGNFIVSHLRNIRSSKNPDKAKAQAHFSGILAPKSYPFDIRKYSTNMETSYMLDSLNFGSSVESNVIYSQKSWIPKSICVNVTSQLFGNSFNLLELDVRAENLERMVEKLVGPKGYVSGEPDDIGNDINTFFSTASARARQTFRPKRGVSHNDIDALAKQVNLGTDFEEQDESLDLSLKLFGNEVAWIPLHGKILDRAPTDSVNNAFDLLDAIFEKIKNIDVDYTKHKVISESMVAYPTAMGVPLKIKGVVTAAFHFKLDGKLDVPAILRDPLNAIVKFQLIPSGAVSAAVISMMETAGLNTGVKVSATAHSSTGSDVTVRILEGKGVDVKVGLPIAKQEASLNIRINAFSDTVEEKSSKPVTFTTKREEYSGCFDQVSEFLGLTFCGEVSTPWDGARVFRPAYGPTSITARIEKEDPSLTSFHFKAFYNVQKDAPQHHFEIVLDTPNSKKERRLGIVIDNTLNPNLGFKATVDSPFGNAKFDTSLINSAAEKSFNSEATFIDQEYLFKVGIKQASANKYKPFLEYKVPEGPESRFAALRGGKPDQQQVSVSGDVELKGNKLIFDGVKLIVTRQEYVFDGSIWDEAKTTGVDMKITTPDDVINVKAVSENLSPFHSKKTVLVASNKYPDISVSGSWDLDLNQNKKETKLDSKIVIVHGPDPNSESARITLTNFHHCEHTPKGKLIKVESKNLLTYPIVSLEVLLDYHGDSSKIGYEVKGAFETYKVGSSLEINISPEYSVDFTGNLLENTVIAHMKRDNAGEDKSKFTNSLELTPGGKYQLNALVTHKFSANDVDALLDVKITLPSEPKNIEIKTGVKDNEKEHEGVLWASIDGKNIVDGKSHISKGSDIDGNFKLVLPDFVDSHGEFKFTPAGADANALIHLLKSNKKIEGKTHIAKDNNHVKGTTDLCLDGQCVKLSSDVTISEKSYDTKGKLELPSGLTLHLAAKGDEPEGSHSAEAELKLSSGYYSKASYASTRHMRPGDADVEYVASIEDGHNGAKSLKLEAKMVGKHIDLEKQTGDGQVIVTFHSRENKDLSVHTNFKRAPAGDDKWTCNTEVGISGSLVTSPVTLKFESELDDKYFDGHFEEDGSIPPGNYQLKLEVADLLTVDSHGKGAGHTVSNELNINLPHAKEGIKDFKWSTNTLLDLLADNAKLKSSNTIKWDSKFIKTNVEVNEEDNGVNFNFDVEGDSIPKKTLSGSAHHCELAEGVVCKNDGSLALVWDGKKADITVESEVDPAKKFGQVHLKGTMLDGTPFEVTSKGQCNNAGDKDVAIQGETTAIIGEKKWTGTATVEVDSNKRHIDIEVEHPNGEKSQFKSLDTKKGDMHYTVEHAVKWVSYGGGSMVGDMDINVENEHDFSLTYNLDAPVMNMNKFHFGAKVTPDNKFSLDIQNDGKTVAAAKTSYQFSSEGTKKKIKGSGNINIQGKEYPLNYDAAFNGKADIHSPLEMTINAKAGERTFTFNSEGKPNNVHIKRTYCKSAGDCSEAEILYENKFTDPTNYEQNFLYKLDLSLFNPQLSDIKLSSKVKAEGLNYNQNLDVDWGETKLNYVSFIQPNKAGSSLVLPQRTIAAEAYFGLPKKDRNALKLEGSIWLDKAKSPNKKTHLILLGEVSQKDDLYNAMGEVRFNNPGLPKPLSIKGKTSVSSSFTKPSGEGSFDIDIFKKPKMKITGNWKLSGQQTENGFEGTNAVKVKSEELKINANLEQKVSVTKESASFYEKLSFANAKGENKEAFAKLEVDPKKLHVTVSTTNTPVLDYLAKWEVTDSTLVASESAELFGVKYSDHLDISLRPLKVNYKFINDDGCENKAFTVAALFEMGKSTSLDVGFGDKSILHGEISLAEGNFLRPSADYDEHALDAIKDCNEKSNEYFKNTVEKLHSKIGPKLNDEIQARTALFEEAAVDWDSVLKMYLDEVEKIQDEILADKNVQGVAGLVKETLSKLFENVAQQIEAMQALYGQTSEEIKKTVEDLSKTIKELIPAIQKSFNELFEAFSSLSMDFTKTSVDIFDAAVKEIAAHKEEIKAFLKSVGDVTEEYGKMLYKHIHLIHNDMQGFIDEIAAKLQEFPIADLFTEELEVLKGAFDNLGIEIDHSTISQIASDVVSVLEEGLKQLKDSKTFPQLETLIETIITWIKKALIDHEQVDNVDFGKKVTKQAYEAVKHLAEMVQEQANLVTSDDPLSKAKLPTLSSLPLNKIPTGLLRLSGITWLSSTDLPSIIQVISTYLPATNPDDWLPPFNARGYLLGGSEIITFDGAHISVGGDCSYVLTQDYLDGNFSVVAQFKGGKLDAIQVTDGKDSVELRHGKKPLVNGNESEFPIFQGDIRSWKRAAVVGLSTKSGLKILCTPDCLRCKFKVEGLYFGRLRGLLGTYNYETYDDLTLPSGEIADSADKFLSAWAVGGGCNAQSPKDASREATCTKTFTDAPDFLACYHLVNAKPYRIACDNLAAKETTPEGLQAAVCNVAFAYSLQCQTRIPTAVPSSCLKCAKTNTNIFQSSTIVKPPFLKADVVFAVERFSKNEAVFENIKSLIPALKTELASAGISDVKFGLVGFGGSKRKWPAYYTNNGKILSEDLEKGNLAFDTEPAKKSIEDLFDDAAAESGVTGKSMTYMDLVEFYPWRMGSAKVVLGIHSTPCKQSHAFFMLQHLYYISSYLNKGIIFHTVSPVRDLELPGGDASKVIAISGHEVFLTNHADVDHLEHHGDEDAKKKIKYTNDVCFTFASMTGGSVFPVENYEADKGAFNKILKKSIYESLTTPSKYHAQKCSCHPKTNPYDGIFAQPDCRILNI